VEVNGKKIPAPARYRKFDKTEYIRNGLMAKTKSSAKNKAKKLRKRYQTSVRRIKHHSNYFLYVK